MNIFKALLAALGVLVALIVVGALIGGFVGPGPAYVLGRMMAPVDIILVVVAFFYAKRRFDRKKKPTQPQQPAGRIDT